MQSLIIHGRQPALGRAELESIYGASKLRPIGDIATGIDIKPQEVDFMRLGGMVKFCKILTVLETVDWKEIEEFLVKTAPQHFSASPEGKLKLGISAYGLNASPKRIQATALEVKKAGRKSKRSVRVIPNKEAALNSAQVLNNKLTQKLGWELVFVRDSNKTIVAQSIAVQDIDAYRRRDHERPHRDARVGMLPPKLAQTILNFAGYSREYRVLDPFCGTGVVLQEALLMGGQCIGSDIDPRMVEYSEKNLEWLCATHQIIESNYKVCIADATQHTWGGFQSIACETFLGRPLSSLPDEKTLNKIVSDCDTIHKKFLQNIARQVKPGVRMCIAVPAWKTSRGFRHLPTLDKLEKLGYNRLSFAHAKTKDLIYHRPDQLVARELVVLTKA